MCQSSYIGLSCKISLISRQRTTKALSRLRDAQADLRLCYSLMPRAGYCSCCLCLYFGSSIMLVTYFVNFRSLNDHLFGKELFILFAASAFRKLSSIYVFSYFPFGFEGRISLYQFKIIAYLFTLHIRALVVVPCGGPKKSPLTFI